MTLLYFSPVPWDSYAQRPHHMVRHVLGRPGSRAIWVDPYPTRLPAIRDAVRLWRRARLTTPRLDGLTVVRPGALPIEPLVSGRWATRINRALLWRGLARRLPPLPADAELTIGIGRPHGLALASLERIAPGHSFYDAMDDFPEFFHGRAARAARASEAAIAKTVTTILTSSRALFEKFAEHAGKRRLVPNGFDMSLLPPVAPRPAGPPVLGYVGCVGSWFDWAIVVALARRLPGCRVRIIGPMYTLRPARLPANVELRPACDETEAVRQMQQFSAGLIPFKRNALTSAVDPIKYYGYRALGLPVITTAFGEMARRSRADGAFTIDGRSDLAQIVAEAQALPFDAAAIHRFRAEHSWARRWGQSG